MSGERRNWPFLSSVVVIFDLGDSREWDFYNLATGGFDLHAGSGECLRGFHAAHDAPDTTAIDRDYLDIVLTVQGLQCSESFCDFHSYRPFCSFVSLGETFEILHISSVDV
jgi:hypothetical protein